MPDGFGRMTRDEASPQLTKFLFGDGSRLCIERPGNAIMTTDEIDKALVKQNP